MKNMSLRSCPKVGNENNSLIVSDVMSLLSTVTEVYNSSNVFEGNDTRLAYTAREPIARGRHRCSQVAPLLL